MADAGIDNEADSGTNPPPPTSNNDENVESTPQEEESEQNDAEGTVSGSNTNYDSAGEGNHRCDSCDFEAIDKSSLTAHVNQVHGTKESEMEVENNNPPQERIHRKLFECDVCNMKFSNGANMRRHKMRHTGVKPYECRVCQKRFFRKDHLAEHFTTHTKTLPYHCPICNRGFQRQIAMRAHFQNEHVGQHDLVKSCPLCSYRAGSMKSLRVHFFNRHGIDLDNPGPAGSSASLLAAAAQQGFPIDGTLTSLGNLSQSVSVSMTANYSDSGDSTGARSTDNATPPMHFLTPHVEISMADAPAPVFSPTLSDQHGNAQPGQSSSGENSQRMNGDCPGSPQSADSNSNAPTSSHTNSMRMDHETSITPSISLIPIKQEPNEEYEKRNGPVNLSTSPSGSVQMQTATSSSLSSLIKVSPLKSLLRDDLKRKIVTRSSSSRTRSSGSPNHNNPESSPNDSATTTNGTITSTGPEQPSDSSVWRANSKRSMSGLQCVFCGIAFPDQTLYFLHKGCHSDANPWKCNICGEQCCNVYEFNSHLLSKSHQ
ncbi:PREDICTED: ikaros family zinc finger protein-like [Nicrophorus vespilloides]|uniref:Ikaros family zinc finger protein-like n=1 Tax=Nicrophorus vespilloides TaxID=110193 RepID=A0ABM1MZH0_NICVS|nr:PREDICTED: ikaros family zinc finger protein-like [Nicrophorus vespilloides]XP_017779971.1 PREDICTED: ikaros family zinc finger protein-like [Nicrophorus vespilloides]XP_017779972.1 PREDICTED: ikaros family zinc finger protein-like [Nicrophorus vespilloides]